MTHFKTDPTALERPSNLSSVPTKASLVWILAIALMAGFLPAKSVDKIKKLTCKSKNFSRKECSIKGSVKAVLLLEQKSDAPCEEGTSFGFSGDYVWVDQGCSGRFEVSYSADSDSWIWGWWNQQSRPEKRRISCKSKKFKPNTCRVEGEIRSLKLRKQKSESPCTFGVSYGYRGESVWVSDGCEASFEVEYDPGSSGATTTPRWGRNRKRKIKCESKKNKWRTCRVDGPIESLQLHKQKSNSPCVEGETYGFTGDTIWVDKGCRAEFEVRFRSY